MESYQKEVEYLRKKPAGSSALKLFNLIDKSAFVDTESWFSNVSASGLKQNKFICEEGRKGGRGEEGKGEREEGEEGREEGRGEGRKEEGKKREGGKGGRKGGRKGEGGRGKERRGEGGRGKGRKGEGKKGERG